jgi:hypothetical protein
VAVLGPVCLAPTPYSGYLYLHPPFTPADPVNCLPTSARWNNQAERAAVPWITKHIAIDAGRAIVTDDHVVPCKQAEGKRERISYFGNEFSGGLFSTSTTHVLARRFGPPVGGCGWLQRGGLRGGLRGGEADRSGSEHGRPGWALPDWEGIFRFFCLPVPECL